MLARYRATHKLSALSPTPVAIENSPPRARWASRVAMIGVLLLHAWLALSASRGKSTTVDEMAHLMAGHALWSLGDYRLQPENGVLPQLWEAVPAVLAHRTLPAPTEPGWRQPNVWSLGHVYFHQSGNNLAALLLGGRAMNIIWSLATGLLVFAWARRLFAEAGAWVSFLFWAFCPTFLAHGALATSDMALTFFMLASVTAYAWHLRTRGALPLAASSIVMALAFVSKYSAVLLLPMAAALAMWHITTTAKSRGRPTVLHEFSRIVISLSVHAIVIVGVIWAFHAFRYLPAPRGLGWADDYTRPWNILVQSLGSLWGPLLAWSRAHRLLPDAYLYGFGFVIDLSQLRGAFLNGEISLTGWLSFFPLAFLYKTPLALLLAGGVTVAIVAQHTRESSHSFKRAVATAGPLIVLFAVYWIFSLTSKLNIGQRHLLPTYPVVFVAVGALGWAAVRWGGSWRMLPAVLLAGQVAASTAIRPDYLAFFNVIAGGPKHGYEHLVDSSLDWGQDLPGLAIWLRRHVSADDRVYVAYFGTGDPRYYGIAATPMVPLLRNVPGRPWYRLESGVYCISVTLLEQAYSPIRTAWNDALEREFQDLRALEPALLDYDRNPEKRVTWEREIPAERWSALWRRYEQLRFARLCYLLRARPPNAQVGYSINVYRLSDPDIRAVMGSASAWRAELRMK